MSNPYSVKNNWLYEHNVAVESINSSRNKFSSGNNICDYIILHYTGGPSATSAHNTFLNPKSNVSWHLTIHRDGSISQLYDFRKRCWHAGISNWQRPDGKETGGLNKWAIGIEIIAGGPLTKVGNKYYGWWQLNNKQNSIPLSDVYIDKHGQPWHAITENQKQVVSDIVPVLQKKYKCLDIMGHQEISPGRKTDPGPQGMLELVNPLRKKHF